MRMKKCMIHRSLLALAVSAALGGAGMAHATNGYFAHGYGTQTKAMGGAGMALSHDSFAPGTNPAGIAGMSSRIDGALAWFRPDRSYTVSGNPSGPPAFGLTPGTVDSRSKNFFIPSLGFVHQIDDRRSWGIAVLANGGLNTDFPDIENAPGAPSGTFFGGTGAGVNLEQLLLIPTYAQTFMEGRLSIGVSPILGYQRFKAEGLAAFSEFSVDPENLSDNSTDTDTAYGGQLGFQAQVNDRVRVGANYRSKLRGTTFDDFSGLFAEGGDFDIPETWGLGVAFEVTAQLTVAVDYQRINYSDVDSVGNPFSNLFRPDGSGRLGAENGAGFGWEDINVFKIGFQYAAPNGWTWRAGYNRGENPIPDEEVLFNILAPGVMEDHFTFGFSTDVGESGEIHFASMYAPSKSVRGPNPLDPAQTIKLEMDQFELELGYSYRF